MLETFRKYTGLMFVVLILLFIGLVFFGSSQQSIISGPKVIYAHDRGFTQPEFNRMAANPARMLRDLAGDFYSPRYQAVDPYLRRMGVMTYNRFALTDDQLSNYLVNRVSLQKAMNEFGVKASTAEVEQFLKETIFWENGKFDEAAYDEFVKKTLPKLGMTVKDMNDVIGEILAIEKLAEVMGSGVEASRDAVLASYLGGSQRASYQLVSLPLSKYEAQQTPSEEEIKQQWEENKGKYLSKPKRRLTYIIASPKEPEATEGEETPPQPADAAKKEEERKRALIEVGTRLDQLSDELSDAEGEGLDELAARYGFEIKSTELIEKEKLPAELQGELRDAVDKTAADLIFEHELGDTLWDATSEIKRLGDDQWLLFRVDEVVPPRELSFEEAREEARSDLVREQALEAMKEDAEEKRTALKDALASGKSFQDAAKELELTPVSRAGITRPSGRTPTQMGAEFDLAAKTNPGEVSEVIVQDDPELGPVRAVVLYLDKREVYENPNLDSIVSNQLEQARQRNQGLALDNWFAQQRANADLRFPQP